MNGSIETHNDYYALPTPRTSLQNIGEKKEDEESRRIGNSFHAFGANGFTFLDFLDIINPLHHIPLVSTMYRSITSDEIDPGSRIVGGSLFGGPIGTVVALANITIEQKTGQDIGNHMMAFFSGESNNSSTSEASIDLDSPPQSPGITNVSSPISTNAEVLEWAQRESANSAEAATEAQSKTARPAARHISANLEVLNWAQKEIALMQPAVEAANTRAHGKDRDTKQATLDRREVARSTVNALGRDQNQLSGAISPNGGWFSESILIALARYEESAQLAKSPIEKRSVEATDSNN
jgi:hypothetical protein